MLKFRAASFYILAQNIELLRANTGVAHEDGLEAPTGSLKESYTRNLQESLEVCHEIGLVLSARQIARMLERLNGPYSFQKISQDAQELHYRIIDEAAARKFFQMDTDTVVFYEKPSLFGQPVTDKFPSAIFDIEEAGKCYALGRNTACVMHLMRVMEVGLKAVAVAMQVPDPGKANWNTLIDQINAQIKQAKASKGVAWLASEQFFTEVSAHLFAVKNAWRNNVMHADKSYSEDVALDILNAVKGFMRHAAEHLDESGQFTP